MREPCARFTVKKKSVPSCTWRISSLVDELGKAVYKLSLLQRSPEINRLGEAVAHTNRPLWLSFSWLLDVPWCTLNTTGLLAEEKIYYLALLDLWWGYTTVRIYVATGDLLYLSVPPSS